MILLSSFAILQTNAQKLDISGSVMDADNFASLSDAIVTLTGDGGEIGKVSPGAAGSFTFRKVAFGSYTIKVEAEGYEPYEKSFKHDYSGEWIMDLVQIKLKNKKSKKRTKVIDYTRYDQLIGSWGYAKDKAAHARELISEANRTFTPADEEYYGAYKTAGMLYSDIDFNEMTKCYEIAFQARKMNFPFITRNQFQTYPPEYVINDILFLGEAYAKFGLFNSAIQVMESYKDMVQEAPMQGRVNYFGALAWFHIANDQPDKAIEALGVVKDVMESGEPLSQVKSNADVIYKIDKDDPKWLQKQQQKAKEEYEKSMQSSVKNDEDFQQDLVAWQYYNIMSQAYYMQFKWQEAIPYLLKYQSISRSKDEKLEKMTQGFTLPVTLPDSVKRKVDDSNRFLNLVKTDFSDSWKLVIANYKIGQQQDAKNYSNGLLAKAVYHQLSKEFNESKAALLELEGKVKSTPSQSVFLNKTLVPFQLNLFAASNDFAKAHSIIKEELKAKEQSLQQNFSYFTEAQRKEFVKEYTKLIDQYYSVLLSYTSQDRSKAFEILDKSLQTKGLILDITREQDAKLKKVTDPQTLKQIETIKSLRNKQAAFSQQNLQNPTPVITDSINRYAVLITDLQRKVNEQLGTSTVLKPVSWKNIQAALKPEEAFVEIVRVNRDNFMYDAPEAQYWAFVVKAGTTQPEVIQLSDGSDFEVRNLKGYQNRLRSQLDDNTSYTFFWKKIADATSNTKRVYLSADGVYHMINPITLRNPETNKYVLEETDLVRVSTGRDLLLRKTSTSSKTLALLGNPAFTMNRKTGDNQHQTLTVDFEAVGIAGSGVTRSGFVELPGTQKEVDIIEAQAKTKGIAAEILENTRATEANVKKLVTPGILHIATHGEFDTRKTVDSYLKSKLILAGAGDQEPFSLVDYEKYEDGFLTAYEVTQLDLSKTQLVVLSACETGLGEVQSGEGVWGLQRAFQLAGARSVMGSLWKISDEATVSFMEAFYKSYFAGAPIHNAYKTAMIETKKTFPHPYFWGAFVLNSN